VLRGWNFIMMNNPWKSFHFVCNCVYTFSSKLCKWVLVKFNEKQLPCQTCRYWKFFSKGKFMNTSKYLLKVQCVPGSLYIILFHASFGKPLFSRHVQMALLLLAKGSFSEGLPRIWLLVFFKFSIFLSSYA
jgi:hypothetical protein